MCFIIWELGEVYGAGTSNYSPSRSSSETCIQMRADQVSGNWRTTNRETVTNGEPTAARSPSQARRPAPGGGTELQRGSLPGGKRSAHLGQARTRGSQGGGAGGGFLGQTMRRPGEQPAGPRVASFSSTWQPPPPHRSPCRRGAQDSSLPDAGVS